MYNFLSAIHSPKEATAERHATNIDKDNFLSGGES